MSSARSVSESLRLSRRVFRLRAGNNPNAHSNAPYPLLLPLLVCCVCVCVPRVSPSCVLSYLVLCCVSLADRFFPSAWVNRDQPQRAKNPGNATDETRKETHKYTTHNTTTGGGQRTKTTHTHAQQDIGTVHAFVYHHLCRRTVLAYGLSRSGASLCGSRRGVQISPLPLSNSSSTHCRSQ